jgi:excisionase family DNA binding protein
MLLTLAEVARRLGVSAPTARKVVRQIPAVRVGARLRYLDSAVEEYAKTGTMPARQESHV